MVIGEGIDNGRPSRKIDELMVAEVASFAARFEDLNPKESPIIEPYREAFKLLNIDPIVDLGNALSLKYVIPIWRQSEDGKITENTRNVLFPLDGFTGVNGEQVPAA